MNTPTPAAAGLLSVLLAAAGCSDTLRRPGGRPEPEPEPVEREAPVPPGSWTVEEIDRHAGRPVVVDGILDHRRGTYGFVITRAGVRVGIPNFDDRMAGIAWLDHVGKPVRITGVLIAPATSDVRTTIPGFTGPTIRMESFEAETGF